MTSTTDQTTAARLVDVDPATLTLDANIRTTAVFNPKDPADAEFAASIAAHGVLVPVVATPGPDGALRVLFGQRRTLAAAHLLLRSVPVHVIDDVDQVTRILGQRAENHDRKPLGTADEAAGFAQLAAIGLTVDEIADRAGIKTDRVDTLLKVAGAKPVMKAAARYDLTIDQAAGLAEFTDDTKTLTALTETAADDPARFEHALSRARQDRQQAQAKAAAVALLEEKGVPLVESDVTWKPGSRAERLDRLKAVTEAKHRKCPGHAAYLNSDWDHKNNAYRYKPQFVCLDWVKNGHTHGYKTATAAEAAVAAGGDEAEAQRKARRLVIDRNKAMLAATAVRRRWLVDLFAQSSPPAGAEAYIARTLTQTGARFRDGIQGYKSDPWTVLAYILGLPAQKNGAKGDTPSKVLAAVNRGPAKRATALSLARLLAVVEASIQKDAWKNPDEETRAYFAALQGWGYALSDVELLFVKGAKRAKPAVTEPDDDEANLDIEALIEGDDEGDDEADGVEDVVESL